VQPSQGSPKSIAQAAKVGEIRAIRGEKLGIGSTEFARSKKCPAVK
jgi:hypothetical protein